MRIRSSRLKRRLRRKVEEKFRVCAFNAFEAGSPSKEGIELRELFRTSGSSRLRKTVTRLSTRGCHIKPISYFVDDKNKENI